MTTLNPARSPLPTVTLTILALYAAFSPVAAGQSLPSAEPGSVAQTAPKRQQIAFKRRITFDLGDAAMLGGGAWDVLASQGKQEAGVGGHGNQFALGANIGIKAGVYGLIKTAEYFYPEHPRLMKWVKVGFGVGWGVAGLVSSQRQRGR